MQNSNMSHNRLISFTNHYLRVRLPQRELDRVRTGKDLVYLFEITTLGLNEPVHLSVTISISGESRTHVR